MKTGFATFLIFSSFMTIAAMAPALADADDVAWIKQCVADNSDQHQTAKTVDSYCACMNDAMSASETKSITEWEKTHKPQEQACATKAGWTGK